ncbi:tyrosine-type recombinase/integrase [Paenibacillus sp. WC2504]|uniref:tyrosine-type recombinase/integrase n=1 Tax=Paenibacillus sp. WC2504 TaxID=3461403 RepID=UPI00404523F2
MQKDIESFIEQVRLHPKTLKKHKKYLNHFLFFLSQQVSESPEFLDLEKIYKQTDINGVVISFYGLDHRLIDKYFTSNIHLKSYFLIESRYALGSFFTFLARNFNFNNPILNMTFNIKQLTQQTRESKTLTPHEILKLNHAIVQNSQNLSQDLLLFSILFSTGCRISEILSLRVKQIRFDQDSFLLSNTKNGKQRIVVMMSQMGQVLYLFCKQNHLSDNNFLFQDSDGNALSSQQVRESLHHYCLLANIDRIKIHGTRHTFATIMYESGVELPVIKQLLGQNSISVSQKYIHANYTRNINIHIQENNQIYKNLQHLYRSDDNNYPL